MPRSQQRERNGFNPHLQQVGDEIIVEPNGDISNEVSIHISNKSEMK